MFEWHLAETQDSFFAAAETDPGCPLKKTRITITAGKKVKKATFFVLPMFITPSTETVCYLKKVIIRNFSKTPTKHGCESRPPIPCKSIYTIYYQTLYYAKSILEKHLLHNTSNYRYIQSKFIKRNRLAGHMWGISPRGVGNFAKNFKTL